MPASSTETVLLGTGSGPTPKPGRSATAHALIVGDALYIVDCGPGVGAQLVEAGISLSGLSGVFVTHHHFDHNADMGALLFQAWSKICQPVPICAPPPAKRMFDAFFDFHSDDIDQRIAAEGRIDLRDLPEITEIVKEGQIYQDEHVKVSCCEVDHYPAPLAFAFRFDTVDGSVVFSGDTRYCERLAEFAQDADLLIHEAMDFDAFQQASSSYRAPQLSERARLAHSSPEEAARIAQNANVSTLVLSPLGPATGITDEEWRSAAEPFYTGNILVGVDLMSISLSGITKQRGDSP